MKKTQENKQKSSLNNQIKMRELIEQSGITLAEAAVFITEETKRPCSVRSLQAWLADASKPSARPCPEWALNVLKVKLLYSGRIR